MTNWIHNVITRLTQVALGMIKFDYVPVPVGLYRKR
jgi:hypothetical protein